MFTIGVNKESRLGCSALCRATAALWCSPRSLLLCRQHGSCVGPHTVSSTGCGRMPVRGPSPPGPVIRDVDVHPVNRPHAQKSLPTALFLSASPALAPIPSPSHSVSALPGRRPANLHFSVPRFPGEPGPACPSLNVNVQLCGQLALPAWVLLLCSGSGILSLA